MNTNVLSGIRCPVCGQEDEFSIEVTTIMEVSDDGTGQHGDTSWDDSSFMRCKSCGHEGHVRDFHTGKAPREYDNVPVRLGVMGARGFQLLHRQKLCLLDAVASGCLSARLTNTMMGLINFLDHVQDEAVDRAGVPERVVFGRRRK